LDKTILTFQSQLSGKTIDNKLERLIHIIQPP